MILLIDIGNTRIKWASCQRHRLGPVRARAHHGAPEQLVAKLPRRGVDEVWIAQVLGRGMERRLATAVRTRFGFVPRFARVQREALGLRVAYRQPARLGVDRWLAMLGLWRRTGDAFCIASAGTATTFDAVDSRGRHLGGLIAPGLRTAERAVLGATRFATLPRRLRLSRGLGQDTESCVQQGALFACAGLVDRAARGARGKRFLCGGDARALRRHLEGPWRLREHLVLDGLQALACSGDD